MGAIIYIGVLSLSHPFEAIELVKVYGAAVIQVVLEGNHQGVSKSTKRWERDSACAILRALLKREPTKEELDASIPGL